MKDADELDSADFDSAADAYFRKLNFEKLKISSRSSPRNDFRGVMSSTFEDRLSRLEAFQQKAWPVIAQLCGDVSARSYNGYGNDISATLKMELRLQEERQKIEGSFKELQETVESQAQLMERAIVATKDEQALQQLQEAVEAHSREMQELLQNSRQLIETPRSKYSRKVKGHQGEVAEDCIEYKIAPSTWEVALFLFGDKFGIVVSLGATLLLALTVVGQTLFSLICYFSFTQTTFNADMERAYAQFRLNSLHDHRYMNEVTRESFVSRLCSRSLSLELGSAQADTLSDIDGYLGNDSSGNPGGPFDQFFAGPLMCVLALCFWCMTVLVEVRQAIDFAIGLTKLPTSYKTCYHMNSIVSIASSKRCCLLAIGVVRLGLGLFLLYVGGMFLALESNVQNILLNTCALEFVLHIDQLVFSCFARDSMVQLIEELEPLKIGKSKIICFIDVKNLSFVIFTAVYIACFFSIVVHPLMTDMRNIEDTLCMGNHDFVFARDGFGFIHLTTLDNVPSRYASVSYETMRVAIQSDRRQLENPFYMPFAIDPVIFGYSLGEISAMGLHSLVDFHNPTCMDLLPSTTDSYFDFGLYVQVLFGTTVSRCADIKSMCNSRTAEGTVVRFLCPIECNCIDPFSESRTALSRDGCPSYCTQTPSYLQKLIKAPCVDYNTTELVKSIFWNTHTEYLLQLGTTQHFGIILRQRGCNAFIDGGLSPLDAYNLCFGILSAPLAVRPFAQVCPEACKCNDTIAVEEIGTFARACPGTCAGIQSWQFEVA